MAVCGAMGLETKPRGHLLEHSHSLDHRTKSRHAWWFPQGHISRKLLLQPLSSFLIRVLSHLLHGAEVKIILFETSLDFKSSRTHLGRTSKGMIFKMEDLLLNERCFIFWGSFKISVKCNIFPNHKMNLFLIAPNISLQYRECVCVNGTVH